MNFNNATEINSNSTYEYEIIKNENLDSDVTLMIGNIISIILFTLIILILICIIIRKSNK